MNIPQKYFWIKLIPRVGIIPAVIDTSDDGRTLEKVYLYYHVVISAFILSFIN